MAKRIIIVGGGISGLSAGIFARKYGFDSVILEKHNISGGQCAFWFREGSLIDGSLHWLTGTKEGTGYNKMWREIGALGDGIEVHGSNAFFTVKTPDGELNVWRDIDKFEAELLALSPKDKREIKRLIRMIKGAMSVDFPTDRPMEMMNIFKLIKMGVKMVPALYPLFYAGRLSCAEYSKRFRHPLLKTLLNSYIKSDQSLFQFIMGLSFFIGGNGDVPEGGALGLVKRVEKTYLDLGGELRLNSEVDEVVIEGDHATGVRLKNGDFIPGDYVVMTCDAHVTYHHLLKNKFNDGFFEARFSDEKSYPINSAVQIALATDLDLKGLPENNYFSTEPYTIANRTLTEGWMRIYNDLKNKAGKTTIISLLNQDGEDYLYWNALYTTDKRAYYNEKKRVGEEVMRRIVAYMPALEGHVKLIDVATPVTYERYCNSYKGSYMSFRLMPKKLPGVHKGYIKGLKNCLLSGQWLYSPGGLPIASSMGKFTIQRICKKEKIKL